MAGVKEKRAGEKISLTFVVNTEQWTHLTTSEEEWFTGKQRVDKPKMYREDCSKRNFRMVKPPASAQWGVN